MELFKYNESRINKINAFMDALLKSSTTEEKVNAYRTYEKDIEKMTPLDMFYLHHYSLDTDLSIDEIKKTANKFINVFHKGLEKYSLQFNHSIIHLLNKESEKIEAHLNILKEYYKSQKIVKYQKELLSGFKKCLEFELKFIKFENIIFPNLEDKLPSTKPFEVLWSLHDDARGQLKKLIALLEEDSINEKEIIERIGEYYYLVFGINQKERLIILPLLEELLSEDTLNQLFNESIEYGFVFMDKPEPLSIKESQSLNQHLYETKTGSLSHKQLSLVLNHIPVDITFVGKDDKVKYFNNRKERHFPRNPSVIGRLVKHCHPPKSIHIVEKIVNDFKEGKRDFAEFWIEINNTFLYITYYAIRDKNGRYEGVLEVSQDVTHIRELKGEKRLL
ncbi:PAS domain-containing protein [Mycoplasmatota bacterium]|nr:PAS domain-containing protein [Mycoplasmatota bacterium]